jgi:hypothetical protein
VLDRRAAVLGLVAGLLLLAITTPIPATSASSPQVSTFYIQTSAPPLNFVGNSEVYVIQASVPVASWWVETGSSVALSYTPGSQQATLHFTAGAGTDVISIQANATGYKPAWQNWTLLTYKEPYISSLPAFNVVDGIFYNYSLTTSVAGSIKFVGAPYLTAHNYSGNWVVSGTVTAGNFTNLVQLNTSYGNFTQYWVTSDGTVPASLTFNCYVGHHFVSATMPVGSIAIGCGNEGLFEGNYPQITPAYASNSVSYQLTGNSGSGYAAYTTSTVTAALAPFSGVVGWFYANPGSSSALLWNGASVATPTYPSSGFTNNTFLPPAASVTPVGPVISVSPTSGAVGTPFVVTGTSFTSYGAVNVFFSGVVLTPVGCTVGTSSGATVAAGSAGTFVCTFNVPNDGAATLSITATDSSSGLVTSPVAFTITAGPSGVASVLTDSLLILGAVLILVGVVVAIAAKRYGVPGILVAVIGGVIVAVSFVY